MKADVLLGLQWGDEGKGKVVDVLTPRYDLVARFQGGPNAGHTLEFEGKKFVLRSIPSGVFQGNINIIGNGVVLDPVLFREEAEALVDAGVDLPKILKISTKAHLILPTHRMLDAALEAQKGDNKIGTTGKGIGPTYEDKIGRGGLRLGDLLNEGGEEKFYSIVERHKERLKWLGASAANLDEAVDKWLKAIKYIFEKYEVIATEYYVNRALDEGKTMLCEGAQGTMLDIDFGSYPFVTSSNTISAGACTGLGVPPNKIGDVYGIFKAYCTRVGSGPFPTELFDETGRKIRDIGHEYGAVTGRERRCGWLDLVALKYAVMINGVTKLIMMKSDVLDTFPVIKVCTEYDADGKPVYQEFPGWQCDLTKTTSPADFPERFKEYIAFIEQTLGVPVAIVSVGPDRKQTIEL